MKMTRRTLAASAIASAAAVAQNPPAAAPDSPEELMAAARSQLQRNGEALAKVAVPISLEPAFQFKP